MPTSSRTTDFLARFEAALGSTARYRGSAKVREKQAKAQTHQEKQAVQKEKETFYQQEMRERREQRLAELMSESRALRRWAKLLENEKNAELERFGSVDWDVIEAALQIGLTQQSQEVKRAALSMFIDYIWKLEHKKRNRVQWLNLDVEFEYDHHNLKQLLALP